MLWVRIVLVAVLVLTVVAPTSAGTPGESTDDVRDRPALISTNESPGCDDLYGVRGPYMSRPSNSLSPSEPVRGPWGDLYGRTIGEVRSELVPVNIFGTVPSSTVYWVHPAVVPSIERVNENLRREAARGRRYPINGRDVSHYRPATVPPNRHLSFHATGTALDLNVSRNPYRPDNVLITNMPAWFVDAWVSEGWCWGGDWQSIKDTMHFAWKGPIFDDEKPPEPYPPSNPADRDYGRSLTLTAPGGPFTDAVPIIADFDRDGAADIGRLARAGSTSLFLNYAIANHAHQTCELAFFSASSAVDTIDDEGVYPLADDFTGDGRVDIAIADTNERFVVLAVHEWGNLGRQARIIRTRVPTQNLTGLVSGDMNRDGHPDLMVRSSSSAGEFLEVWTGPDYDERRLSSQIPPGSRGALMASGDADLDGRIDVYLLSGDGTLVKMLAADRFEPGRARVTKADPRGGEWFYVFDYDGDGHRDLFLVSGGRTARVFLGGERGAGANLSGWFVRSPRNWSFGTGCSSRPTSPPGGPPQPPEPPEGGIGAIDQLVASDKGIVTASEGRRDKHELTLFDAAGGRVWTREYGGEIIDLVVTKDGRTVASVSKVGPRERVTVIQIETRRTKWDAKLPAGAKTKSVWFEGNELVVVAVDTNTKGTLVLRYRNGQQVEKQKIAGVRPMEAVPFGERLVIIGSESGGTKRVFIVRDETVRRGPALEPGWRPVDMVRVGSSVFFAASGPGGTAVLGKVNLAASPVSMVARTFPQSTPLGLLEGDQSVVMLTEQRGAGVLRRIDAATALLDTGAELPRRIDDAVINGSDAGIVIGANRNGDQYLYVYSTTSLQAVSSVVL